MLSFNVDIRSTNSTRSIRWRQDQLSKQTNKPLSVTGDNMAFAETTEVAKMNPTWSKRGLAFPFCTSRRRPKPLPRLPRALKPITWKRGTRCRIRSSQSLTMMTMKSRSKSSAAGFLFVSVFELGDGQTGARADLVGRQDDLQKRAAATTEYVPTSASDVE